MGKKSRRVNRRERPKRDNGVTQPSSNQAVGYEEFLKYSRSIKMLAAALEDAQEARWQYVQVAHDVDPPDILEDVLINPEGLLQGLEEMELMYSYIANKGRVPAETKNGANWIPPLPPGVIAHLAGLATDGDETFRIQAAQNEAKHQKFEAQKNAEADTSCLQGNNCKNRRVTWPGKSLGPACWLHVTEEEKIELSSLYDQAVQELPCRACHTAIGEPCDEEASVTRIDGYYSPIRSFNKRKLHKVRLDDYARTL
ncbi:MAG: hypothetical protein L0I94_08415 [Yaniella sp.]|nr:hypothetical protein [Yaniella sp.]